MRLERWLRSKIWWLKLLAVVALVYCAAAVLWELWETSHWVKTHEEAGFTGRPDLFAEYYKKASEILEDMTLEEKVGQIFMARMPREGTLEEIETYHPGAYILFGRDFAGETPESLRQKLESYQAASNARLIFGVDEEGGSVVRASLYPAFRETKFLAPLELYTSGGVAALIEDSKEKSALLRSLGIQMNLAPVADVTTSPDTFIYERSLGLGADETATCVAALVTQMNADNIISVMKHFPGYGDNADTHTGVAIDERQYEQFREQDFVPFLLGTRAEGPAILVNHNIVTAMDAENPASLSPEVHRVLREELGFTGVIMTDDLAMGAVAKQVETGEVAVRAVKAGNDLIITSDLAGQTQQVLDAIQQGEITEDEIEVAALRVLAMKLKYGVIAD